MSSRNTLNYAAPYERSQPSETGRLDVSWPGGIGTIDAGKITTTGGGRRRRKHKHTRNCKICSKKHRKHRKTRKSKNQKR